jgi:aspartate 1-decarboxylase
VRSVLHAVIENATVTHTGDSRALRIDPYIMRAAELLPFERVEVINGREVFTTWIEPGTEASGEVQFSARAGDVLSIAAFAQLHEGQTVSHKPKFVKLDARNKVVSVTER